MRKGYLLMSYIETRLGISERIVSTQRFETRVTDFSCLYFPPSKEVLKTLINSLSYLENVFQLKRDQFLLELICSKVVIFLCSCSYLFLLSARKWLQSQRQVSKVFSNFFFCSWLGYKRYLKVLSIVFFWECFEIECIF